MSKEKVSAFIYDGLEIPFFRIVSLRVVPFEGNNIVEIKKSFELKEDEQVVNVIFKVCGNNDQITKGDDNIILSLPEKEARDQINKYHNWLLEHEKKVAEMGHGLTYKAALKHFEEDMEVICKNFEAKIQNAFELRELDISKIIKALENKNKDLESVIEKQEKTLKKYSDSMDSLMEQQKQLLKILSSFNHDLEDYTKEQELINSKIDNQSLITKQLIE